MVRKDWDSWILRTGPGLMDEEKNLGVTLVSQISSFPHQLALFSVCSPASRTFRASMANFFFPLVLLLGLAISAVPVLYSIFLIPPSKPCGPFRGQSSIWAQIPESISSLPQTIQNFIFFLGTQAFAVPLLLISSILMVYTLTLANSYGRLISELKRQIETEAQNKVFLAQRAVALSSNRAL